MSRLNWFERRRLNRALKRVQELGELTFPEVKEIVKPHNQTALIYELAHAIADGQIRPRYECVHEGIFVEAQDSLVDFGPEVDIFRDVEVVYMRGD